ncbi:hypothetical protein ACFTWH_03940 [Streptomyces sp. NPDC057011]|uniref:hypothetical protein n=1 Tax=unclassified Streptomyces TaxID=2593676 RepID=UPI00363499FC
MTMAVGIPGARERLTRAAEELRACLRSLAGQLTPGQVPEFPLPDEPFGDHGRVPALWHYSFTARVRARDVRPPREAYPTDLAARAAALLTAGGWGTPAPRAGAHGGAIVTGARDGTEITVSVVHGNGEVLYAGRTAEFALYEPVPHVRPEPVVTEETLTPGQELCYECDGLGWCPACGGRGWVMGGHGGWGAGTLPRDPDRLGRCPLCFTRRFCPICRGAGQLPSNP